MTQRRWIRSFRAALHVGELIAQAADAELAQSGRNRRHRGMRHACPCAMCQDKAGECPRSVRPQPVDVVRLVDADSNRLRGRVHGPRLQGEAAGGKGKDGMDVWMAMDGWREGKRASFQESDTTPPSSLTNNPFIHTSIRPSLLLPMPPFSIRPAVLHEKPQLEALIA